MHLLNTDTVVGHEGRERNHQLNADSGHVVNNKTVKHQLGTDSVLSISRVPSNHVPAHHDEDSIIPQRPPHKLDEDKTEISYPSKGPQHSLDSDPREARVGRQAAHELVVHDDERYKVPGALSHELEDD